MSTTSVLAEAIAAAERPPAFLAGNGISVYGDQDGTPLTEESASVGDAFLTRVAPGVGGGGRARSYGRCPRRASCAARR